MIKNGRTSRSVPVVDWLGEDRRPFWLLRFDEMKGRKPKDGHDPQVPHRISFHALMLVAEGSFDHWIDFRTHRLRKNQMIYIAPNQTHRFMEKRNDSCVWALIFRPDIFPAGLQQMHGRETPWSVLSYLWPCITRLKPKETALLVEQMQFLRKLESMDEGEFESIQHFVLGVIGLAFELSQRNSGQAPQANIDARFLEFIQLMEENFRRHRDAKWYATRMDCSQ
ncbi:MAG: AraC family ligand binding domain-containing protein, partial [Planctomycetota bacterium]